jgi:glycosyltransferase involved in cell wall biosynthesis
MQKEAKLKIIYLAEWDAYRDSGVLLKITGQVKSWRLLGAEAHLLLISPRSARPPSSLLNMEGVFLESYANGNAITKKFHKGAAFRRIRKAVVALKPDVIYYRDSSWSPGLNGVLKKGHISVFEINSGSSELWLERSGGFGAMMLGFLSREWLRAKADGFVCVTPEIGLEFDKYAKPVHVVTNGFDVEAVALSSAPSNIRPQLVFVASGNQTWQGIDKLGWLAESLPEYDFHLVGPTMETPPNLYCHGYRSHADLGQLYRQMDVGIGSLALHRKCLKEACPLKVREYLAHGLPVIGAYNDPDCIGSAFFLELPNREDFDDVDLAHIRAFVDRWRGKRVDGQEILIRIGAKGKEQQRLDFFGSLVERTTPGFKSN